VNDFFGLFSMWGFATILVLLMHFVASRIAICGWWRSVFHDEDIKQAGAVTPSRERDDEFGIPDNINLDNESEMLREVLKQIGNLRRELRVAADNTLEVKTDVAHIRRYELSDDDEDSFYDAAGDAAVAVGASLDLKPHLASPQEGMAPLKPNAASGLSDALGLKEMVKEALRETLKDKEMNEQQDDEVPHKANGAPGAASPTLPVRRSRPGLQWLQNQEVLEQLDAPTRV